MAEVDEKLAPLIIEIWKAGIPTLASCQRHFFSQKAWIAFVDAAGAEQFLNIVLKDNRDPPDQWGRAESWYFGSGARTAEPLPRRAAWPLNPEGWEFHATVKDDSTDFETWLQEAPAFRFEISILMPRRDVKVVLERVRAYNEGNRSKKRARQATR